MEWPILFFFSKGEMDKKKRKDRTNPEKEKKKLFFFFFFLEGWGTIYLSSCVSECVALTVPVYGRLGR